MPLPDAARTSWVLRLVLPEGDRTCSDVYEAVYGVQLHHGAKPWPWFLDAKGQWWSLSTDQPLPLTEVLWLVDLDQLGFHPPETHRPHLEGVLAELQERAATLGGEVRPAVSVEAALARVERIHRRSELEQALMKVILVRVDQTPVPNREWMRGLAAAGLILGDGDLYWMDHQRGEICAEPWTENGWFHPEGPALTSIALHIRISAVDDLELAAEALHALAEKVVAAMDVVAVSPSGHAFHPEIEVQNALKILRELDAL